MKTYNALSKSFTDEVKTQMGGGKSIDDAFEEVKLTQLTNGHEYVDLDLPSGTIWATCNVGADKPEDQGLLFQFGRVDGYTYNDSNNRFINEPIPATSTGKEYKVNEKLDLNDDAAYAYMGGAWRMPTKDDIKELYAYTTYQSITINNVNGVLFTSTTNEKQLFIPSSKYLWYNGIWMHSEVEHSAYLWSSQVHYSNVNCAYTLSCDGYTAYMGDYRGRSAGLSVRGVF